MTSRALTPAELKAGAAPVEDTATVPTDQLHQFPEQERRVEEGVAVSDASVSQGEAAPAAEPASEDPGGDYRIGPGDVLEFYLQDDPTLSREAAVRDDGNISLLLVPDIRVAGCTRTEATEKVRAAYSEVFNEPTISLRVAMPLRKVYYVMGEVVRSAEYDYVRPVSVIEAINVAGGQRTTSQRSDETYVGDQGRLTKAFIVRHGDTGREVIECNLTDMLTPGAHPSDTPVFAGDLVYVPEGLNLVYLIGEVGRSDVYRLVEGMTLRHLLARAGGVNAATGRLRSVVLMREVSENTTEAMIINVRKILRDGQDIELVPGDVIYVPRKPLIEIQDFVTRFTGTISPLLNLYNLAWDTHYKKRSLEQIWDNNETSDMQGLVEAFQSYGSILQGFTSSMPELPALP